MAFFQFKRKQQLPTNLETIWDFITSPENLKQITPEYMGFDIQTKNLATKVYEGMMIAYTVKPMLGIPLTWVTEITHVVEQKYFVDEQRIGPYTLWHHEHWVEENEDGVLMTDIVSYSPPGWIFGTILNDLLIKKQLDEIFDYRKQVLENRNWQLGIRN